MESLNQTLTLLNLGHGGSKVTTLVSEVLMVILRFLIPSLSLSF